jgi:hypothetical protein
MNPDYQTYINEMKKANPKDFFLEHGFFIWQNIFTPELLLELKQLTISHSRISGIKKHFGIRQPHAFKFAPFILKIFAEEKMINSLNHFFNESEWFITNHADLHTNALSGWHKDDGMSYGNGGYFNAPSYKVNDTQVYKVAIYMQDHDIFQDGLTVIPKSHHDVDITPKKSKLHLETRIGDVIIFDPRLSHTGQLHCFPKPISDKGRMLIDNENIENNIIGTTPGCPNEKMIIDKYRNVMGFRNSIFFTVASHSDLSHTFIINNMKRQLSELSHSVSADIGKYQIEMINSFNINNVEKYQFFNDEFNLPSELLG